MYFELGFYGHDAKAAEIDLYDVSVALSGFHRSLALTTHLILNDEIIVQAPSLNGATINALVAEEGSWKLPIVLTIIGAGIHQVGTAPKDTPLGHLVHSAYDYVVQQSLGFHVDYDKSLGQQYDEAKKENQKIKKLDEYRFDSLIEKCENSIKDIHRPIHGQGTAKVARIKARKKKGSKGKQIGKDLNDETFEYISKSLLSTTSSRYYGRVSSYNSNTYSGRIFVPSVGFAVPFRLTGSAKNYVAVSLITSSLVANSQSDVDDEHGFISFNAFERTSKNGRLKSYNIVDVSPSG